MTGDTSGILRVLMRRAGFAILVGLVTLVVVAGAFAGYLITSNRPPREEGGGWIRVRSLPSARGEFAAAVVESQPRRPKLCPRDPCPERLVYVVGGLAGLTGRTIDSVHAFDPPTNSWREGPPLPEPRHHAAAAGLGDTLYVTGGGRRATDWTPRANVWVLRPGRTSFERLADMPEARIAHGMVAAGGKLYVVGGRGRTSRVLIFDAAAGTWTAGAPMPHPRDHAAVVAAGGRIFAIGGRDGGLTNRVDVYDVAADEWEEGPPLPLSNSAMAVAFLDDGLIHVVGGEEPSTIGGGVTDRHLVLAPGDDAWLEGPPPLLAVHGAPGVNVEGRMLVVGGSRRQGSLSIFGWTGLAQVFDPARFAAGPTPSPGPQQSPTPRGSPTR